MHTHSGDSGLTIGIEGSSKGHVGRQQNDLELQYINKQVNVQADVDLMTVRQGRAAAQRVYTDGTHWCPSGADHVVAAGASEGDGENGVSSAWPHRQGRALPVVGGGAAGNRAAQAVHQLATAQNLEDVIGMPAPCMPPVTLIDSSGASPPPKRNSWDSFSLHVSAAYILNSLFAQVQIGMTMLQSGDNGQVNKATSSALYCKQALKP